MAENNREAGMVNNGSRTYGIAAFGEILIDFTSQGRNEDGQELFAQNPGGAPANVAVAAGRLGARTAFLGKAGQDMHGRFLKHVLQQENVEMKGFILDEHYFTTLAFVSLSENGERTFSFARKPGADTQMTPEEMNLDVLAQSNIFHVGSLSLTNQPSRDTTRYAVQKAKELGCIISYDPNYRESLWKSKQEALQQMRSLIPYADVIKISEEETELLTGYAQPEHAAEALLQQGVKAVAVTLGEAGAYVFSGEGARKVPGFLSKAVDTTGAGDSFWGGFLYCLNRSGRRPEELQLQEIAEYAYFGNAAASLCVEGRGAIPAMPVLAQVEERMRQ